jgi:predicted RNA polymerase sigma factor
LPGARADLLKKLGRWREAQSEFERAASLTRNAWERKMLLERAAECARTLSNGNVAGVTSGKTVDE